MLLEATTVLEYNSEFSSGYAPQWPESEAALIQLCNPATRLYDGVDLNEKHQRFIEALLFVSPFRNGNHRTTAKVKKYYEDTYGSTLTSEPYVFDHEGKWATTPRGELIIKWFYEEFNDAPTTEDY